MLKLNLNLNVTVSFPRRIIGSSAEQAAEKSEEQKTAKRDLEGAVAEGGETVEPILDAFGAYSTCAMFTVYNVRLAASRLAVPSTRVHRTMPWVVSFLLKRPFGPRRGLPGPPGGCVSLHAIEQVS